MIEFIFFYFAFSMQVSNKILMNFHWGILQQQKIISLAVELSIGS